MTVTWEVNGDGTRGRFDVVGSEVTTQGRRWLDHGANEYQVQGQSSLACIPWSN